MCGYLAADLRLCFRYIDSTIPLFSKPEILSLKPSLYPQQTVFVGVFYVLFFMLSVSLTICKVLFP